MHDRLFSTHKIGPQDVTSHAQAIRLDLGKFQRCVDSGQQAMKIHKDLADGQKAGIKGTPTFFLGLTEPKESKIKVLKVIEGAQDFAIFRQAIDSLLSQK
jgi:predicted DsbA family dithiol-disulfide isomerase